MVVSRCFSSPGTLTTGVALFPWFFTEDLEADELPSDVFNTTYANEKIVAASNGIAKNAVRRLKKKFKKPPKVIKVPSNYTTLHKGYRAR